jgi:hypothetical protein
MDQTMHRRAFMFSVTSAAFAAWAATLRCASAAEARLACRAFFDRTSVPYDGEVALTALLECMQSGCEVFVPLTWGFRGFLVSIADASGAETQPPINDFHPPPPQELKMPDKFVRMYKGLLIGETLRQRASDFFPKRGMFTVRVGYLSPVPRAYTNIADAITEEDGTFLAPPISVTVT